MDGQLFLAEWPGSQSPGILGLPGPLGMALPLAVMLNFNQNHRGDMIKWEMPPPHLYLSFGRIGGVLFHLGLSTCDPRQIFYFPRCEKAAAHLSIKIPIKS